jgi:hypothetical protein
VFSVTEVTKPALAVIEGFGLRRASLASSVAHDTHNIIAVGTMPSLFAGRLISLLLSKAELPLPMTKVLNFNFYLLQG